MNILQLTPENGTDLVGINDGADIISVGIDYLTGGMGEPLFGLFIGAFVVFALYYASGGYVGVPAVFVTLGSAWLLTIIPVQYHSTVIGIVIVGLAAGMYRISQKYFMRPNA